MHSNDDQLRSLLLGDESSNDSASVASHVEHCPRCQDRLESLSGAGIWTKELLNHLRTTEVDWSDRSQSQSRSSIPLTVVLNQPADVSDDDIELDRVSLDFLDEAIHPELLGRLGRYDIEQVIGAGGMGLVLRAYDGSLHRTVAIKVLAPHLAHSAAARRRFAREAQATAAVIHPHVIPIFNVEAGDKLPYLVMSYVNGPSLQSHVDEQGPLSIDDTLRIARQTAAGLAAAHAQGLIHRDVKPANILLDEGTMRVVLSDFGLARTVDDASLTRTGIVTGTPHYMSPEQANGDAIDCRSDLFSLGCVLWFMVTGRPPFRAATAMGVLNRICHENHRPVREVNSQVPVPLAEIIDRLLAKQADNRFTSALAVEAALEEVTRAWRAGELLVPSQESDLQQSSLQTKHSSNRQLALGGALLGAVILALTVFQWPPWLRTGGNEEQGIRMPSTASEQSASTTATLKNMEARASEYWRQEASYLNHGLDLLQPTPAELADLWKLINSTSIDQEIQLLEATVNQEALRQSNEDMSRRSLETSIRSTTSAN